MGRRANRRWSEGSCEAPRRSGPDATAPTGGSADSHFASPAGAAAAGQLRQFPPLQAHSASRQDPRLAPAWRHRSTSTSGRSGRSSDARVCKWMSSRDARTRRRLASHRHSGHCESAAWEGRLTLQQALRRATSSSGAPSASLGDERRLLAPCHVRECPCRRPTAARR